MKIQPLKLFNLWFPVILWMGLIFKFSSGSVPVASDVYWQDFAIKKFGHFLLFGFLALLIYRGLIGEGMKKKKAAIWAIVLATFYGATDEYHQMFTQGREARVRDIFVDGIGSAAFVYILYSLLPKFPRTIKILTHIFGDQ